MKVVTQPRLLSLLLCLATALTAAGQDVRRFSALLEKNDVPEDLIPYPIKGIGIFMLAGGILQFEVTVDERVPWVATINGPTASGSNGPALFELFGVNCFTPLPPIHHGGCDWRGTAVLTESQIADLAAGRLYVSLTWGGFPSGFAVEGRIFLDNNQNRIPDTDEDSDHDGVSDADDLCPNTPRGVPINSRGCTLADVCPCEGGWRNHGAYVRCVEETIAGLVNRGAMTRDQAKGIQKEAAKSNCGKR